MQTRKDDIRDSERNIHYSKNEITGIDLPSLKDTSGRENIHLPHLKAITDTAMPYYS